MVLFYFLFYNNVSQETKNSNLFIWQKLYSYCGWLGQLEPCCITNTRWSFWKTLPSFPNSQPSFWFSLKASKAPPNVWKAWSSVWKARPSIWKARPCVLKQVLGWMFCLRDSMKIWSVKGTVYSLESSVWLIFLIYILSATIAATPKGTRPVISQFVALVTYLKYPNLDLITNIWKRKNGREKRKRFKLNGKFQNWKQISEESSRLLMY